MATNTTDVNAVSAPTRFVETRLERYAYRRFGEGTAPPLVFLQHFTGTLDNWDPAVADAFAGDRDVILFESAGVGRSTGEVPATVDGMVEHLAAFLDALGLTRIDLLGFSLGGMVAQQVDSTALPWFARCCWLAPRRRAATTSCTWRNRSSGRFSRTRRLPVRRCS